MITSIKIKNNNCLNKLIKQLRDYYDNVCFINSDGSLNLTPAPRHNTPIFINYGIIQTVFYHIFSSISSLFTNF